eukprot:scaffold232997_cov33-Tisochrysis_lutea.AAC.3
MDPMRQPGCTLRARLRSALPPSHWRGMAQFRSAMSCGAMANKGRRVAAHAPLGQGRAYTWACRCTRRPAHRRRLVMIQ